MTIINTEPQVNLTDSPLLTTIIPININIINATKLIAYYNTGGKTVDKVCYIENDVFDTYFTIDNNGEIPDPSIFKTIVSPLQQIKWQVSSSDTESIVNSLYITFNDIWVAGNIFQGCYQFIGTNQATAITVDFNNEWANKEYKYTVKFAMNNGGIGYIFKFDPMIQTRENP